MENGKIEKENLLNSQFYIFNYSELLTFDSLFLIEKLGSSKFHSLIFVERHLE